MTPEVQAKIDEAALEKHGDYHCGIFSEGAAFGYGLAVEEFKRQLKDFERYMSWTEFPDHEVRHELICGVPQLAMDIARDLEAKTKGNE